MSNDINTICDRLLDSEEHAVESAIPQVAEDAVEVIRSLAADALRFRKLKALLQAAYDGNTDPVESGDLTVYCSMLSGWRNERTVKAEVTWRDERDADLDLASVLDKMGMRNP